MGQALNAGGKIVVFSDPTPQQRAAAKARAGARRAALPNSAVIGVDFLARFTPQEYSAIKAALVSAGLLTKERADIIFAPLP